MPVEVVPHGVSPVTYGRKAMWARRREKYGPTGMTLEARAKQVAAMIDGAHAAVRRKGKQPKCGRGHRMTPENTRLGTIDKRSGRQRRYCLACQAIYFGQQAWRKKQEAKIAEELDAARQYMIDVGVKANQNPDSKYWRDRYVAARERWQQLKRAA